MPVSIIMDTGIFFFKFKSYFCRYYSTVKIENIVKVQKRELVF